MKQLKYYMMILSALLFLGGCSDDDDPATEAGLGGQISLSADKLQAPLEGGTVSVTVTSSGDWRLAGVCDWVHPSATEGRSGEVVTFDVDENTTGTDLSTVFKFFTGSSVAPLVIESVQGYTMDYTGEEVVAVEQAGGQLTIRLRSNISDLTVELSEGAAEWLTLDGQTEFGDDQIVRFTASANEAYLQRSATVTLSSPLAEGRTVAVTFNQAPTELFEVTQDDLEDNVVMGDLSARSLQFTVVTNLEFTADITSGGEWISAPQVSAPETEDNGLSTYTVTCEVEGSAGTRAGTLTFTIGETDTQEISIVQKDPDDELVDISRDFSGELVEKGWILPIGTQFIVLEAGLNATVFESDAWIDDLTGLDQFPNLESIGFNCDAVVFDISGLHKVREVNIRNADYTEEYNFGDNPITSYNLRDSRYGAYCYSLKFVSEKLENLDCSLEDTWGYVETLDVSECPSLKTLNAVNFSDEWSFTTIIVKEGQDIDITKPDNVAIEYR